MEERNNMENTENQAQEHEKMFTQEEVNKIVQNRLARAKSENNDAGFAEKEAELSKRELQLDAREKLVDAGLPKELVTAINCSSKEAMEKSIETLISFMNSNPSGINKAKNSYRVISTGISGNSNAGGNEDANIRKAMGLKG